MVSNQIKVENFRGLYRIRVSEKISKKKYISTGLRVDIGENLTKVQDIVLSIQRDILHNEVDETLEKYKPQKHITRIGSIGLAELWNLYCEYKKPMLSTSTYELNYRGFFQRNIDRIVANKLTEARDIESFLYGMCAPFVTKTMLQILSACYQWAVDEEIIKGNPFKGRAARVKLPTDEGYDVDPFTFTEAIAIIKRFEQRKPHYAQFVKFLFLTGCRPGEACALRWENVADDYSVITIKESYSPKLKLVKCTKTNRERVFRCNSTLRGVLASVPRRANEYPVFTNTEGNIINHHTFVCNNWRGDPTNYGIVEELVDLGEVVRYRSLYNTRRTFITEAINSGLSLPQVARLTGTSASVIMKHYYGNRFDGEIDVHFTH